MNQFNLCNNDIIIILVLFFVFCIFLYMTNTKYNYENKEHFVNTLTLVNTNENKKKIKDFFETFFKNFITHANILKQINDEYTNIINNTSIIPPNINTNLTNINTYLDQTKNELENIELDQTLPIVKEYNALITNITELFETHNELFEPPDTNVNDFHNVNYDETKQWTKISDSSSSSSETTQASTSSGNETTQASSICNQLNLNFNVDNNVGNNVIINFYYNLNNHLDVIKAKNISQLKLIKINIDNIKYNISNSYFNDDFRIELLKVFDAYYNLLNVMYNENSVNIFNIINEKINNCDTEAKYDKSKLIINNQNSYLIIKSFTKLEGEFKYFELDKIFVTSHSANKHFEKTKGGLKLWQNFCEKLKKLNKPNKKNLILKKFNIDLIEKKTKYIKQLEDTIFTIQNKMNDTELQDYDINRIRTNEQANKQYQAIKKGIDNIKNRNKIKINLT
jgi:hypothetical protein